MKRDVTLIALNDSETLVLASDNSGGIGLKDMDMVKTPYDVVAYYGFRVAVMECIASGGAPISVVLHNFCGDESMEGSGMWNRERVARAWTDKCTDHRKYRK